MDPIFDRLGNLLRSFFQDEEPHYERRSRADKDFQEAWDELNDFLSGENSAGHHTFGTRQREARTEKTRFVPAELKEDYKLLRVEFGAPFSEVKKSYKNLLLTHHPDYHQDDPEQATAMTQKLNYSFQRIKKFEQTGNS